MPPSAHRGLLSCGRQQAASGSHWVNPYPPSAGGTAEPMPGRGRGGTSCTLLGYQIPMPTLRPRIPLLSICHNSTDLALPRQNFCAPHLSSPGPVSPSNFATCYLFAAQTPESGTHCRWVQVFLLTPNSLEALEAAESWQGGSGVGIHSPSSTTFHPAVREGAASLLSSWTPAQRLGCISKPNTLLNPGKKCPSAQLALVPQASHTHESTPDLASVCCSPQPSVCRHTRRGEEGSCHCNSVGFSPSA